MLGQRAGTLCVYRFHVGSSNYRGVCEPTAKCSFRSFVLVFARLEPFNESRHLLPVFVCTERDKFNIVWLCIVSSEACNAFSNVGRLVVMVKLYTWFRDRRCG